MQEQAAGSPPGTSPDLRGRKLPSAGLTDVAGRERFPAVPWPRAAPRIAAPGPWSADSAVVPTADVTRLQVTAAWPGDRAEAARSERHRAWLPALTQRHLQIALGALWLLDGGLQFQPFMFSHSFLPQVIEPTAAGQPHMVAVSILGAAHLMSRHLAFYNTGAAAVQILIGVGLLYPRTVKPALFASFGWALGVWAFGEGFGLLLTGQANPLTGAPGAVLLYLFAGLLIWPAGRPIRGCVASQGLLKDHGGRLLWANLWLGFAALSVLPTIVTSSGVSGAFQAGGSIAPGPLAHLDAALGRGSAGHGIAITIGLAAVELGIGAGIMHDRWRNTAAVAGAAFALAIWATAQGLGGLTTGQATDPNSGPLLVLLAAALYLPAASQPRQAARRKECPTAGSG